MGIAKIILKQFSQHFSSDVCVGCTLVNLFFSACQDSCNVYVFELLLNGI